MTKTDRPESSKQQIFCFTHAGGSASFFDTIAAELSEYSVTAIEYPGHGKRFSEPFCGSLGELAEDALRTIKAAYSGGGYALFGYSMGCLVLIEALKRTIESGTLPLPKCVFLAAHEPKPHTFLAEGPAMLTDELIKDITVRFGGVPVQLIGNKAFWRLYTPMYRADYTLILNYRYDADVKTDIPAVVFYSDSDTPVSGIEKWKRVFVGSCELVRFDGSHFFIEQHHSQMAGIIDRNMRK